MNYNIPIPKSRGFTKQEIVSQVADAPITTQYVRDLVLHALLVRASYNNNDVREFRTTFENDILDVDIDQQSLDEIISTVSCGAKLNEFKRWLFSAPTEVINVNSDFSATSLTSNRSLVLCDSSGGNILIDLTDLRPDFEIIIKKIDESVNAVNFNQTIDNDTNFKIVKPYESITIVRSSGYFYII